MKCKSDNPNENPTDNPNDNLNGRSCRSSCRSSCRASSCIKIALMAIAGIALLGWIVMLLWNWLLPSLFVGAQPVDYCQALGILVLSKILFGGFRGFGHRHRRDGHHGHPHHGNMSPEEREQMKAHIRSRWSKWCCSDKAPEKSEAASVQPATDEKK